jgi:uncharacterized protein with PIN domain
VQYCEDQFTPVDVEGVTSQVNTYVYMSGVSVYVCSSCVEVCHKLF